MGIESNLIGGLEKRRSVKLSQSMLESIFMQG